MRVFAAIALALVCIAGITWIGFDATAAPLQSEEAAPAPLPTNPTAAAVRLVSVQPFTLEEPYTHWWCEEQPSIRAGYIVVLQSDPELLRPRQTLNAVLYVGDETAERCNAGDESGYLVALVPSTANPTELPIWFGDPDLPERVSRATIAAQRAQAEADGVRPPGSAALQPGQRLATFYGLDRADLDLAIADHIERYSPNEVDLIAGLRVPVTR